MRQILIPITFIALFITAVSQVATDADTTTHDQSTDTKMCRCCRPTLPPVQTGMYYPAALDSSVAVSSTYTTEDLSQEVVQYIHCTHCSIGVYHPHDDGTVRCTYCGKDESLHAQ
jgi:hypothetical protein